MIVQMFIAQTQAVDPLPHQLFDLLLDQRRVAIIGQASRETANDSRPLLHVAQQHPAGVGADIPAVFRATSARFPDGWNSNVFDLDAVLIQAASVWLV